MNAGGQRSASHGNRGAPPCTAETTYFRPQERRQRPGWSHAGERATIAAPGGGGIVRPTTATAYWGTAPSKLFEKSVAASPIREGGRSRERKREEIRVENFRPQTSTGGGGGGSGGRRGGARGGATNVYITELLPPPVASVNSMSIGTNPFACAQEYAGGGNRSGNRKFVAPCGGGGDGNGRSKAAGGNVACCQLMLPTTVSLSLGREMIMQSSGRRINSSRDTGQEPLSAQSASDTRCATGRAGHGEGGGSDGKVVVAGTNYCVSEGGGEPSPPTSRGFRHWRPGEEGGEYFREGCAARDMRGDDGAEQPSPQQPHRRVSPLGLGYRVS